MLLLEPQGQEDTIYSRATNDNEELWMGYVMSCR